MWEVVVVGYRWTGAGVGVRWVRCGTRYWAAAESCRAQLCTPSLPRGGVGQGVYSTAAAVATATRRPRSGPAAGRQQRTHGSRRRSASTVTVTAAAAAVAYDSSTCTDRRTHVHTRTRTPALTVARYALPVARYTTKPPGARLYDELATAHSLSLSYLNATTTAPTDAAETLPRPHRRRTQTDDQRHRPLPHPTATRRVTATRPSWR